MKCINLSQQVSAAYCITLERYSLTGRFFETLIGVRKQPMYSLLLKLFVVYLMEPVCTVVFVTNMIRIWEKVMKELRFQVFQRVLIQKVVTYLHPECSFSSSCFLFFLFDACLGRRAHRDELFLVIIGTR